MRVKFLCASLMLGAAVPQTAATAADWSGEFSLVSDYRYRGVSLSGRKPALQATFSAELKSGAYGELWLSTLEDDGAGRIEADISAGYPIALNDAVSLDLSATYYLYPARCSSNAYEMSAAIEATKGRLTGTLGVSLAPPQHGTRDDDGRRSSNLYLLAGAKYAIVGSPLSVRVQVGRERGPWDFRARGSKWDYGVGVDADVEKANLSLDLVGTNAAAGGLVGAIALRF